MTYTSYAYLLLFLGVVFLLYTVVPKKWKWTVLLIASYGFIALVSKRRTALLVLTTLSVYGGALLLTHLQTSWDARKKALSREEKSKGKKTLQRKKRLVMWLILLFNFGLLAVTKYSAFFGGIAKDLLPGAAGTRIAGMLLMPLGISFYTLQAAGYLLDVYHGKYAADRNLGRVALFLCFFPQITEGPIGRYDLLAHQLYEGHSFDYRRFTFGLQRIVWGLFKKVVIADRANVLVGAVFGGWETYSGIPVLLASVLYTVQIYMEFSGAMDIVSGSAELFGVSLSSNFERPFFSKSVSEFWRRWHITLGAWLRDYVLYSVSLSKPFSHLTKFVRKHCSPHFAKFLPTAAALFFVWFGMGIWHGVGWKYVLYGMYYYGLMVLGMLAEPLFERMKLPRDTRRYHVFQILRTCFLVNIGMLLFRADSTRVAAHMLKSIFTGFSFSVFRDGTLLSLGCDWKDLLVILLGTVVVFFVSYRQERGHALRTEVAAQKLPLRWAIYLAGLVAVILFGAYGDGYGVVDLIYAGF